MQSWRMGPSHPQFCSRHLSRDPQNNDCSADPLTPWRSPGFSFGGPLSPRPRRNASVSIRHPRRKSGQERAPRPRPPLAWRPNPLGRTTASGDADDGVDAFSAFIDAMAGSSRICVKRTHISVGRSNEDEEAASRTTEQRFR